MARRKISEAKSRADTLPELTPQQQEFVRLILEGKTASDAYRGAYDCSNSQAKTIWARASELRRNSNVAVWLSAARQANLGHVAVSFEEHLRELERLREASLEAGNHGAAVQAEIKRGQAAGHYVERFEDMTQQDPVAFLEAMAKISPEWALELARQHNIDWEPQTRH